MSVDGTDVVYKDIIEPLESASVTISKTDKSSVTDFGNPLEVTIELFFSHADLRATPQPAWLAEDHSKSRANACCSQTLRICIVRSV